MAYPTIQYTGEKLLASLQTSDEWIACTPVVPMPCSGFKTCDALRANNYFSGPQFGTAGAGVI